jgi:hypothetical protein
LDLDVDRLVTGVRPEGFATGLSDTFALSITS